MARTVSIGNQDFESLRLKNSFYVDKTGFIREWWESEDVVTLIARGSQTQLPLMSKDEVAKRLTDTILTMRK